MRARKHAFANYLVVILTLLWSAALVSGPVWASAAPGAQTAMMSPVSKAQVAESYGRLPLFFTENQGQTDAQVKYFTLGQGHSVFFTSKGAVLSLSRASDEVKRSGKGGKKGKDGRAVVQLRPQGIRSGVEILATDALPGKVNYFQGNDPGKWRTEVPTYKSVLYREAYKGIDLKFYGAGQKLEYDLVIKPGADPKQAKFLFQGVKALKVTKEGDLTITLPDGGTLVQKRPVIYQEIDGQRISREGKFRILPGTGQRGYGFELASYDARYPLIIDPVILFYSTYLGGSTWESGNAIAVDAAGSAYVVGATQSADFPNAHPGSAQTAFGGPVGGFDAFVAKFNVLGNLLVYATYLGGSDDDIGLGIAVNPTTGEAFVTGETFSFSIPGNASFVPFPTTGTAYQTTLRLIPPGTDPTQHALSNAFVTKLNPAGALAYSTYLGGSSTTISTPFLPPGSDVGVSIVVDNAGKAYVAGNTTSADFPVVGPAVQSTLGTGASQNAFVTKIDPTLSGTLSVPYSTYLGGSVSELAWGIAVDPAGAFIYVAGDTASFDFPHTTGTLTGTTDAFVTKIATNTATLPFSTFLGGPGDNSGSGGIALDAAGNFYVAGNTDSLTFPTTPGAFQGANAGFSNAFVTKFSGATGNPVVYSTLLGGDGLDTAWWLAVDASGNAYVTGETSSTTFPIVAANTFKATLPGFNSAFVTKINPQGTGLIFSTYLGGTFSDTGFGLALDLNRRVYVTGVSSSADFPVKGGINSPLSVFPGTGGSTAFVTKLATFSVVPYVYEVVLTDD